MNLNVFIAKSGHCSRRKAAELIKAGKVFVGGKIVLEPWYKVERSDHVKIGSRLLRREECAYIIFNKPKGVTTTVQDRYAAKKIVDYIPAEYGRLYPVGRLDVPSRGLVILTNDGDLCHRITHPKFEVEKEYIAIVKGSLDEKAVNKLKSGYRDGDDMLRARSVSIEKKAGDRTTLKVMVCEGKKRHLRRLFLGLGYDLLDLKRVRIGALGLGNLKEGSFKQLDRDVIYGLTLKKNKH